MWISYDFRNGYEGVEVRGDKVFLKWTGARGLKTRTKNMSMTEEQARELIEDLEELVDG